MPGVLAVLTGADVKADGLKDIPHTPIPSKPPADILLINRDGSAHGYAPQELLPTDRVRYVGPAGRRWWWRRHHGRQGRRRAGQGGLRTARGGDGNTGRDPVEHPALRSHRQCLHRCRCRRRRGRPRRRSRGAAHVAKFDSWVQRVTGVPLDARAAVGVYDPATNKHTLHAGSGGVVRQKHELADDPRRADGRRAGRVRRRRRQLRHAQRLLSGVRAGGVGGEKLGRPVKWTCERSEAFASDYQGRDQAITLELAPTTKARFLAVRGSVIWQHRRAQRQCTCRWVKCAELLFLGLSGAGGAHPRPRGADQHAADQPVSQRRPARGDLRHRAGDRHRRKTIRLSTASICGAAISSRRRRSPTPTRSA